MNAIRSKLMVTGVSALGAILVYRLFIRLEEMIASAHERHPGMGVGEWLLLALWCASCVAVAMVSDRLWGDRKLFLPGDVPFAAMLLYMTASALAYSILT